MQQASWLVICGVGPWLFPGIYPSGIAHIVCPIRFHEKQFIRKIGARRGNGLHDLPCAMFRRRLAANDFLRCEEYGSADAFQRIHAGRHQDDKSIKGKPVSSSFSRRK